MPKLGTVNVDDIDLPEMPSPTMVNVDSFRFDFKNSIRNSDFRAGKQYESLELKKICPNLYIKKFKKDPVPRQFSHNTLDYKLPGMTDPEYKQSLILRAQMRKTNVRDLIYMSHLSWDRVGTGKFNSEVDRKKFQFRYFKELEGRLDSEIGAIKEIDPLKQTESRQSQRKANATPSEDERKTRINCKLTTPE